MCYTFPSISITSPVESGRWRERYLVLDGWEQLICKFFQLKILSGEDFRVSVPCSSLFDIVTVRCGHCTNLWSVNMAAAFQSLSWQDVQAPNHTGALEYSRSDLGSSSRSHHNNKMATTTRPSGLTNRSEERTVNRPPEKRQRVPSAYNQFIKEEIQRIKANNPDISHREAFSTAAKNWAHFPHIHFGLMLETNVNHQPKIGEGSEKRLPRATLLNK